MLTIKSKSPVHFQCRERAEVYIAIGPATPVPPTWGTVPSKSKVTNLWENHWDKTSSTLSWKRSKKNLVTAVPRDESIVFQGVIELYHHVEERQRGAETGYYAEAKHYIREVLNHTVLAYKSRSSTQFKGFTAQLELLWRASDFGSDLLHLSRRARCLQGSHPTTGDWTAGQSRPPERVTAEKLFPACDELRDILGMSHPHCTHPSQPLTTTPSLSPPPTPPFSSLASTHGKVKISLSLKVLMTRSSEPGS